MDAEGKWRNRPLMLLQEARRRWLPRQAEEWRSIWVAQTEQRKINRLMRLGKGEFGIWLVGWADGSALFSLNFK